MRRGLAAIVAVLLSARLARAQTTTGNDSSCDISVAPAATLLLPYFDVELSQRGKTTLFSVTNVSHLPRVAHVTLWTDYGFPALSFNLFLTGYDVQAINLYDVVSDGVIAVDGIPPSKACEGLSRRIPPSLLVDAQSALSRGTSNTCSGSADQPRIGGDHGSLAVGYATIDLVQECTPLLPTSEAYYRDELLFDNVLIGDYQAIDPAARAAGGGPLVHIRAVPEGGPAGAPAVPAAFHYTFYTRYLGSLAPGFDRRQPLPALFAARFIEGSGFETRYKIWREGPQPALSGCLGYLGTNQYARTPTRTTAGNSFIPGTEVVRWDEHGNPTWDARCEGPTCEGYLGTFPETSSTLTSTNNGSSRFPILASSAGDKAGFMYLNLNSGLAEGGRPSQNWVIVSMSVPGLYSVDFDATPMGNGCTPPVRLTYGNSFDLINPAGLVPVCPEGSDPSVCRPGVAPYIGTNRNP